MNRTRLGAALISQPADRTSVPTRRRRSRRSVTVTGKMGRMGRPTKGKRELLGTRLTPRAAAAVRTCAAAQGLTVSDYIAAVLARETGLYDEAANITPATSKYQEALPVSA